MMVKITQSCSMGCTHCLNDSKPCGKDMDEKTFRAALKFCAKAGNMLLMVTGGEPFEHNNYRKMFNVLREETQGLPVMTTIATNGKILEKMSFDELDMFFIFNPLTVFQITNDERFYPIRLNKDAPIYHKKYSKHVELVRKVERVYPQGRALKNNIPWTSKGCKCFNIRAIPKQLGKDATLPYVINHMTSCGLSCTPHIDVDGNIKVGESDLCPVCSNIYKSQEQVMEDIIHFECHRCDFINEKVLTEEQKQLLRS